MLVLKPIKDEDMLSSLTKKKGENYGYTAFEGEKKIGSIAAYCDEATVYIEYLSLLKGEDDELADGLLRAIFDKAAEKNKLYYRISDRIVNIHKDMLTAKGYSNSEEYIYKFFTSKSSCIGCGGCKE